MNRQAHPRALRVPIQCQRAHVPLVLANVTLAVVAHLYETTPARIVAPGRGPYLVEARRVCCQILYERDCGVSAIARVVNRDHSTVLHALRCLERRLSREEWDMLCEARRRVRALLAAAEREREVA